MAFSPLISATYLADPSNYTAGRSTAVNKITVHHMAGIMSAEGCGRVFQVPGRGGSSNYGIGLNGEIAGYVDEANTPWTDSNWASNCRSITIEDSNSAIGGAIYRRRGKQNQWTATANSTSPNSYTYSQWV